MLGKNNMNIGLRDIYRLLVGRRGNDFWEKSHPLHFTATLLTCVVVTVLQNISALVGHIHVLYPIFMIDGFHE